MTQECSICMDTLLTQRDVMRTVCGHIFHSHCIVEYITTINFFGCQMSELNCPLCRHIVDKPFVMALIDKELDLLWNKQKKYQKQLRKASKESGTWFRRDKQNSDYDVENLHNHAIKIQNTIHKLVVSKQNINRAYKRLHKKIEI